MIVNSVLETDVLQDFQTAHLDMPDGGYSAVQNLGRMSYCADFGTATLGCYLYCSKWESQVRLLISETAVMRLQRATFPCTWLLFIA